MVYYWLSASYAAKSFKSVWSGLNWYLQLTFEKAFLLSNTWAFSILPEFKIKIVLIIISVQIPYLTTTDTVVLPVFSITMLAIPASSDTFNSTAWNWNTPGESLKTKQIPQTLLCNQGGSVAEWPRRCGIGLKIRSLRVQVPFWPLAGVVDSCSTPRAARRGTWRRSSGELVAISSRYAQARYGSQITDRCL